MKLNMPEASGGVDFADRFKRTANKHTLRVYPFKTPDGEHHLAAPPTIQHFPPAGGPPTPCLGPSCPMCEEARVTDNWKMKASTKYSMVVVDMDEDIEKPLHYPAPSSVYSKIRSLITADADTDPSEFLGNEGVDLIMTFDKKAPPSDQYKISPKIKGSKKLKITDEDLPDLIAQNNADQKPIANKPPEDDSDGEDMICFTTEDGSVITGKDTGARKGKKRVVEAEGRLMYVAEEDIVDGS